MPLSRSARASSRSGAVPRPRFASITRRTAGEEGSGLRGSVAISRSGARGELLDFLDVVRAAMPGAVPTERALEGVLKLRSGVYGSDSVARTWRRREARGLIHRRPSRPGVRYIAREGSG